MLGDHHKGGLEAVDRPLGPISPISLGMIVELGGGCHIDPSIKLVLG